MIIMQGEEIIQSLEDLKEYLEKNNVFKEHPACEEKISEIIQEIKKNEKEKIEAEILARDGRDNIEEILKSNRKRIRKIEKLIKETEKFKLCK